jgi:3-deoxy-7-phosphoheptulonate synthase
MIIITQPSVTDAQIDEIVARIEGFGLHSQVMRGDSRVVIGVLGSDDLIREKPFAALPGVEAVVPVVKPYKLVTQVNGALPPPVSIGDVKVGTGQRIVLISGPCSVEDKEQIVTIAKAVKKAGARILRGGAYKPRTSPYSFQGLGEDGLRYLAEARAATGLPIITEIMDTRDLALLERYADCLQVGSRNMQNFALLKEVGRSRLPVMLKRGFSATISDLLLSAEYILNEGNPNVMLCERGIRTFEPMTRNTLDLNAVPILKAKTKLPVVVDPTHGIGLREYIPQMALAAVAAGADAVMVEVHHQPDRAWSDGEQALRPQDFAQLFTQIGQVAAAIGREV